jgi:phosphate transport system permease protein
MTTATPNPYYASRKRGNLIAMGLCYGATVFGLAWLILILVTLVSNGLAGLSLDLLTQNTPPPNSTGGGLANAIVGSLMLTLIGVGIGAPIGLLAGT